MWYCGLGPVIPTLLQVLQESHADALYWNHGYTPRDIQQGQQLKEQVQAAGSEARSWNATLLFEPSNIRTQTGGPFQVFTAFWRACLRQSPPEIPRPTPPLPSGVVLKGDALEAWRLLPTRPNWAQGFEAMWTPGEAGAQQRLQAFVKQGLAGYHTLRNRPDGVHTSRLSPHLHFGELSARAVWYAIENSAAPLVDKSKFLAELGWREFAQHVLFHQPTLPHRNMRAAFDRFPWQDRPDLLQAWQTGQTGYPLVDAGMRELWQTGWMHNWVRMVVGSFLVKHLRIHWQEGARWFWDTLVDADRATNAVNWQWVAGSGIDASPFFRIFHPVKQGETYDPEGLYVRAYVPELAALPTAWIHKPWQAPAAVLRAAGIVLGHTYPHPLVDHEHAHRAALAAFAQTQRD